MVDAAQGVKGAVRAIKPHRIKSPEISVRCDETSSAVLRQLRVFAEPMSRQVEPEASYPVQICSGAAASNNQVLPPDVDDLLSGRRISCSGKSGWLALHRTASWVG